MGLISQRARRYSGRAFSVVAEPSVGLDEFEFGGVCGDRTHDLRIKCLRDKLTSVFSDCRVPSVVAIKLNGI